METTRVEPGSIIEGRAIGELEGAGRWQLSNDGAITIVRYDWKVETTKCWMNYLAPIARPIFKWNHNVVMRWGAEELAKRLAIGINATQCRASLLRTKLQNQLRKELRILFIRKVPTIAKHYQSRTRNRLVQALAIL